MNVYAASDLHGWLPDVPGDAELLLLGGDICPDFRPYGRQRGHLVDQGGTQQAHWLDTEFREWLMAIKCPVIAIWGNHDFVGERSFLIPKLPWIMLKDSEIRVGAVDRGPIGENEALPTDWHERPFRVYGTPWVPGLPYWAFHGTPRVLTGRAEAIPEGIDILMTHGPPWRVGDYIPTSEKQRNKYGNYGGMHVGDPTLNPAIERVRPKAVICGHIHEARGAYFLDGVPVYNVAAVDNNYQPHDEPFTKIDL